MINFILTLRHLCQDAVIQTLPRDEAGLLLGITLGLDQPLSEEFSQALRNTSTTHIIVASGYNASIIIATIFSLTGRFGRRASFLLALILLAAYVVFSGGNPSMIRAAVMASIAAVGQLAGRQRLARHILFISATAMLLVNPLWLLDTSFQLSVAATAGIIEIEPLLSTILYKLPEIIKETISTTVAAQLTTLPIIAATFGQISVFGSIANILVLWTVPWVMLTGVLYIPIALVAPWTSRILVWAVEPTLWYIKQIIEIAANLPLAAINVHITVLIAALYYLGLLLIKGSVFHVSVSTSKN